MKFSFLISFFICLQFFPNFLIGNDTSNVYIQQELAVQKVEQADWEKVTQDLDYGKLKEKEKPQPSSSNINSDLIATILKGIGILGIIALVIFLLQYFVGIQGIQKTENKTFDPNEKIDTQTIAEDIHEYDLATLIKQAAAQQDYMVATRLYYLLAIKTLSEKELIKWKKDKTNRNYLNELAGIDLKNQFRELTAIFERVWYGEVAIDAPIFGNIEEQFKEFINSLNT